MAAFTHLWMDHFSTNLTEFLCGPNPKTRDLVVVVVKTFSALLPAQNSVETLSGRQPPKFIKSKVNIQSVKQNNINLPQRSTKLSNPAPLF